MTSIKLIDVHAKLSELAFAVQLALEPINVGVKVVWQNGTYLAVEVECQHRRKQEVVDRLKHGALSGGYDYRFNTVSYPLGDYDPNEYVTVTAYPDLWR